jgi:FtsH-binding integral membrane protein
MAWAMAGNAWTRCDSNDSLHFALAGDTRVLIQSATAERGTVEYMKAFLWLLTMALTVLCFFLWVLARLEIPLLEKTSVRLPPLTLRLVASPNWLWFCPVPWIVASVILSCRKEVSPLVGFLFLGTITLAASLILFPTLLSLALPWLALYGRSISK